MITDEKSMKTMVDFVIDVVHYTGMRGKFVEAVKESKSAKDIIDFFEKIESDDHQYKYEATDDECMRIYENSTRIVNNPWIKNPNVMGY
jgi:hypothetical protein